jgi:hypothetical protein
LQNELSVQLSWRFATRFLSIAALAFASLLCAPVAAHAARISLAWNASTSVVSGYVIYYGTSETSLTTTIDVGNQTTYSVDGLTVGVRYYFEVRAYNAQGLYSSSSNRVDGVAGNLPFTDTLSSGQTPIRSIHITEMRARINALRAARGLAAISWTDTVLTVGVTPMRAVHITQMRTALNQVYTALGRTPPAYTDSSLSTGTTPIKVAHLNELRAAIQAVE